MDTDKVIDLKVKGELMTQCHLMPCRIEYSGSTVKAEEYFKPTIRVLEVGGDSEQGREKRLHDQSVSGRPNSDKSPTLTASFRGKPLQGRNVQLPEGYKGIVIGGQSSKFRGAFKEFTYWNWDELPTDEDSVVKALQWIDISKAIHGDQHL